MAAPPKLPGLVGCFFVLDKDRNVIPAGSIHAAEGWLRDIDRRRVADSQEDGFRVSTVFLCVAHGVRQNEFFETMVFKKGGGAVACYRAETWTEAELNHAQVFDLVKEGEFSE